jgi:hypothetical protein
MEQLQERINERDVDRVVDSVLNDVLDNDAWQFRKMLGGGRYENLSDLDSLLLPNFPT